MSHLDIGHEANADYRPVGQRMLFRSEQRQGEISLAHVGIMTINWRLVSTIAYGTTSPVAPSAI